MKAGMPVKGSFRIGTSGWHYSHWKGPFYPEDIAAGDMLDFYVARFDTVEINNSFYQLPTKKTLEAWRDNVPDDFIFAVKASRYITHMKKLKDPAKSMKKFFKRIDSLGEKLGPILFQLPPRWKFNGERLKAFLDALPADFSYTMEFRDTTWFTKQAYDLLAEHNVAFCIYQLAGLLSPKQVTADLVYVRLHGPTKKKYEGRYSNRTLAGWAGAFSAWNRRGNDVFCYFDNDQAGYAPNDASRLLNMLDKA
jgi:uncharacterized protein YecE (DUF72 family)